MNVGCVSVELMIDFLMETEWLPMLLRFAIVICNVIWSTLKIAGMRWKVFESGASNDYALAMASHAMYDGTSHASHAGLIIHDSSADAAFSWDMSALSELSLAFYPVEALEWKLMWGEGFRFSPWSLPRLQSSGLWAVQAMWCISCSQHFLRILRILCDIFQASSFFCFFLDFLFFVFSCSFFFFLSWFFLLVFSALSISYLASLSSHFNPATSVEKAIILFLHELLLPFFPLDKIMVLDHCNSHEPLLSEVLHVCLVIKIFILLSPEGFNLLESWGCCYELWDFWES